MDWRGKRKSRALRNAFIRAKHNCNKESIDLLRKRIKESNAYLEKLSKKSKVCWNEKF
jgi:hypothetical protein